MDREWNTYWLFVIGSEGTFGKAGIGQLTIHAAFIESSVRVLKRTLPRKRKVTYHSVTSSPVLSYARSKHLDLLIIVQPLSFTMLFTDQSKRVVIVWSHPEQRKSYLQLIKLKFGRYLTVRVLPDHWVLIRCKGVLPTIPISKKNCLPLSKDFSVIL